MSFSCTVSQNSVIHRKKCNRITACIVTVMKGPLWFPQWASTEHHPTVNLVCTSRKHSSVNILHKGGVLRYSLPSHDKACSLLAVAMTTRVFSKPMRVLYFCRPKTSASRGGSACLIIDPCFHVLNQESASVQWEYIETGGHSNAACCCCCCCCAAEGEKWRENAFMFLIQTRVYSFALRDNNSLKHLKVFGIA